MARGNEIEKSRMVELFLREFADMLAMPEATEVCVNTPGEVVVETSGGWRRFERPSLTYDYLLDFGVAVAAFSNNSFGDTVPILSATLPAGERAQFVMPPACADGKVSVTIRKPSTGTRTLGDLLRDGFFSEVRETGAPDPAEVELLGLWERCRTADRDAAPAARSEFLARAVRLGKNIVVAGGTGSGKTTFLKALMQEIPETERIVTIEDVPELLYGLPRHRNQVNLLYPSEAGDGDRVTASTLLRSCLRMKPDRILLAEIRGGEAYDFLNACLSGHGGSLTTCHAGNCAEVYEYLALKVLQSAAGSRLPHSVIERLLHLAVDVVVHLRNSHGRRHVSEIAYEPGSAGLRLAEAAP